MIVFDNRLGTVTLTAGYFAELVAGAAQSSFGVAGMATGGPADSLKSAVLPSYPEKGVKVIQEGGQLIIRLHIQVTYGLNIAAMVKSIINKVKYAVEDATGLCVKRVDVSVDDVIA